MMDENTRVAIARIFHIPTLERVPPAILATGKGIADKGRHDDGAHLRVLKDNDISSFSKKHNLDKADVESYSEYMRDKNLQGASQALIRIKRSVRIENGELSFGEFTKVFQGIKAELSQKFGNVDILRDEYVQREMEKRNVMESARSRAEQEAEAERKRLEEFGLMTDTEMDVAYSNALEAGNEARARDIVNEAARRNGYMSADEFRMAHRAPTYDEEGCDKSMIDIATNKDRIRESLNEQLRMNRDKYRDESAVAINEALSAIDKGKKPIVTVYRAVPGSLEEGKVRNGDWVSLSESYVKLHGEHALNGDYRIMREDVPAGNLYWDRNDINEWGYDDRSDYRYKDTRNNRKLNDLVTHDDKGNIILPSKRFNARKTDTRFRFIGEKGAASLDKAGEVSVRLDNLSVARLMESSGKGMGTIKLATGWERGADGKWRYETGDARIRDTIRINGRDHKRFDLDILWNEGRLADNIDDSELLRAYPGLADIRITTDSMTGDDVSNGSYNPRTNAITIHATETRYMNSILNHEIQHAIQHIEGFAEGGNPRIFRTSDTDRAVYSLRSEINSIRWEGTEAQKLSLSTLERYGHDAHNRETYDAIKILERSQRGRSFLQAYHGVTRNGGPGLKDLDRYAFSPMEKYQRLSGEVEARNVERRMGLTPEERLSTLAMDTEDVSRTDQIFLHDIPAQHNEARYRQPYLEEIGRLSGLLRTPVNIIREAGEITGEDPGEKARKALSKGWFDLGTGEVYIMLPNVESIDDIQATLLHEIVAHKGLRGLLGDKFGDMLDKVYNSLPMEERLLIRREADMSHGGDIHIPTEEFLARVAEKDTPPSTWAIVKSSIRSALRSIGISLEMTDDDIRCMLHASKERLMMMTEAPNRFQKAMTAAIKGDLSPLIGLGNEGFKPSPMELEEINGLDERTKVTVSAILGLPIQRENLTILLREGREPSLQLAMDH